MFRGFKFQVVLPVAAIALLLISLVAIGFSVWTMQHEETLVQQRVADNVSSIKRVLQSGGQQTALRRLWSSMWTVSSKSYRT